MSVSIEHVLGLDQLHHMLLDSWGYGGGHVLEILAGCLRGVLLVD